MIRGTNQRAVRGAVLRTGRRVEEAGHLEGSYQASASNLGPKEDGRNFNRNLSFHVFAIMKQICIDYI